MVQKWGVHYLHLPCGGCLESELFERTIAWNLIVEIKRGDVIESSLVAELVLIAALDHAGSLRSQRPHHLEQVDHLFVLYSLQDDRERNEGACSADAAAAVNGDRTLLAELLLRLVHLSDEVNEIVGRLRYAVLRPVCAVRKNERD